MGHVNPELLDEFLQSIDYPLFCYNRKAEDLIFAYDKKEQKVGLYINGESLCNGHPMKFGLKQMTCVFTDLFSKREKNFY